MLTEMIRNRAVASGEFSEENDEDEDENLRMPHAQSHSYVCRIVALCVGGLAAAGLITHGLVREWSDANTLHAVSWNIAAINNNPFEYWITHDDEDYNKLMEDVQAFIEVPGLRDVPVRSVFTQEMFDDLEKEMAARQWNGLDTVRRMWGGDFAERKIISGFMKDKALGEKRLASMPDRITNTIRVKDGGVVNRPTVINCFGGDMHTVALWWAAWKQFMFHSSIILPNKSGAGVKTVPAAMLSKIKRSKYPAITEEEERISIPLQTLAQAIFDAILVHIVNSVSANAKWQTLQQQMCDALNRRKDERTLSILSRTYQDADIVFLQETASAFVTKAEDHEEISSRYFIGQSGTLDAKRDQNSIILLGRSYFRESTLQEHTSSVMGAFDRSVPVADGDLLVMSVEDVVGRKCGTHTPEPSDDELALPLARAEPDRSMAIDAASKLRSCRYLLASFHGDTNGLATLPVLDAVHKLAQTMPRHRLVFGLDANTHAIGTSNKQGVGEFASAFVLDGYSSCWGDQPNPLSATTFNARTYLQPQLQKAARTDEKVSKGDKNPKDFILFSRSMFTLQASHKDNTGEGKYIEDMVFPTLHFPSDHGLVSSKLKVL